MSKIAQWKKIFGHTEKPKVMVQVSGKAEVMTDTQSYRFEELTKSRGTGAVTATKNPLEDTRYGLQDASFRLMITEDHLLQKAAAGSIRLYVDTTGLHGHWRRRNAAGESLRTALQVSQSGLLALDKKACQELADAGATQVSTLAFHPVKDLATLNIDPDTLETLVAWGGQRHFCLRVPLKVSRDNVVLLPPLVFSG